MIQRFHNNSMKFRTNSLAKAGKSWFRLFRNCIQLFQNTHQHNQTIHIFPCLNIYNAVAFPCHSDLTSSACSQTLLTLAPCFLANSSSMVMTSSHDSAFESFLLVSSSSIAFFNNSYLMANMLSRFLLHCFLMLNCTTQNHFHNFFNDTFIMLKPFRCPHFPRTIIIINNELSPFSCHALTLLLSILA